MKIITKQNIAETRFLNLVSTTYEDKRGKIKEWVSAERPGNQNAVVIVAVIPILGTLKEGLVVIREFRVPLQGCEMGFPAGLINPGQTVEETAIRELREETGLEVKNIIRVTPFVYNSPGISNEAISYAFVEAIGEISKAHLKSSEEIEAFIYDRKQIRDILDKAKDPANGILIGAKSWLLFERWSDHMDF